MICALIAAVIAYSSDDPTKSVAPSALATLAVSAAVSGIVISRMKGEGGVKLSGIASITLILLLFITALISGKGIVGPSAFMNYACYIGVSLLSAYIGRKKEGVRRKRR